MKRNALSEKEIVRLSQILEIDKGIIIALRSLGILNIPNSVALIIKDDYRNMINDAKLPKVQIMLELSIKYNTSRSSIEAIIYDKVNNKSRHCSHCGVELSKYKYTKNGGLCEKCLANKE